MTSEILKSNFVPENLIRPTSIGRRMLAAVMVAGAAAAFNATPSAAVTKPTGCPQPKTYEQKLSLSEFNALVGDASEDLVDAQRDRLAKGVSDAGMTSGSEVTVGAGVNRDATRVPYFVLNGVVQDVLIDLGYKIRDASQLTVDADAAAALSVKQEPTALCDAQVEV